MALPAALLVAALVLLCPTGVALAQQSPPPASLERTSTERTGTDTLRCTGSGHDRWPPFSLITVDGAVEGIAHDVMREALHRIGLHYQEVYVGPWKRGFGSLQAGVIDMVVGTTHNAERDSNFVFTDPIAEEDIALIVPKNSALRYQTWDDLKGLRGTKGRGASYGDAFDSFAQQHLEIIEASASEDALRMLKVGRADYGIAPRNSIVAMLLRPDLADQFRIVETSLVQMPVATAMMPGSACAARLPEINAALAAMQTDGTMAAIVKRHQDRIATGRYTR